MKILSAHFGEVEIDDDKVLQFPNGLPGLEDNDRFALLVMEDKQPISWLQSLDNPEIALPVMDPFRVYPTYSFDIKQEDVDYLGIQEMKDVYVLNVLVIPQNVDDMTINLAAPIIINVANNKGRQVCLDEKKYKIRTSVTQLLEEATRDLEGNHASVDKEGE